MLPALLLADAGVLWLLSARLRTWLLRADQPPIMYIVERWLAVVLPTAALAISFVVVGAAGPELEWLGFDSVRSIGMILAIAVVGAPAVETLILTLVFISIRLAKGPRGNKLIQIVVTASMMATWHGLADPLWGVVQLWPFLIYSAALIAWWEKSPLRAIGTAFAIHALNNLLAIGAIFGAETL